MQNKEFPSALTAHTLYRVLLLERLEIDYLLSNLFKMSLVTIFQVILRKNIGFPHILHSPSENVETLKKSYLI